MNYNYRLQLYNNHNQIRVGSKVPQLTRTKAIRILLYQQHWSDAHFASCINCWSVNQTHHVVITPRAFMGRNVITQLSTNQIHPTEIPDFKF